jgi:hypothetical protein
VNKKSKQIVLSLLSFIVILSLITPVHAWSDVGVQYYDSPVDEIYGEWSEYDNTALEEYVGLWAYYLELVFDIDDVDQTADVYKIRVDFEDADAGEALQIWYRWGDSGNWVFADYVGPNEEDVYLTITDASDDLLQVKIQDNTRVFDGGRDQWEFGREPELWMYWY